MANQILSNNFKYCLFNQLPEELHSEVFNFFLIRKGATFFDEIDYRSSTALLKVCKSWRAHLVLQRVPSTLLHSYRLLKVQEQMLVKKIYPEEMIQLFRSIGISMSRLPLLEIGPLKDVYDPVPPETMTHPIMRFKNNRGLHGVAFRVEGYAEGVVDPLVYDLQIRDIQGVISAMNNPLDGPVWRVGMAYLRPFGISMNYLHTERHVPEHATNGITCQTCPNGLRQQDRVNYKIFYDLLTSRDPFFRIAKAELKSEVYSY